ncbi:AI-2E family transporter [Thermococcus gorgonarius]|uniref:AI-2E family transporter n=1 Tax=Thermococcus gorgonarius TaxID=71997 RepID=A0A2Z2M475_THEGO|nr:AI-2E family transporter [Thermococcus gorgonarius]ASJ00617.1 AI-2E family transporter [Thermococcus gorgonarius]
MKTRRVWLLFLFATVLITLVISWKTVSPLVTSMFFALTLAYIIYPAHRRLEAKVGSLKSALLLTILMIILGLLILAVLAMVAINLLQTFYRNVGDVFNWLLSVELPSSVSSFVQNLRANLMPMLADYVSSFTFSVPGYILQLLVFLLTFYYTLAYAHDMVPFILKLVPEEQKDFVFELLGHLDKTMNALVRAWLLLNVVKGVLMALGYIIFGVSDLYTALVAGFLTFLFSFIPLLEGWMLWVAAAIYLYLSGSPLLAIGISIYGAVLVSPLPDYTIRPKLVAKGADLDETIVFIGMVGGTWAFGLKGILLGPIILSMALVILKGWKNRQRVVKDSHTRSA